MIDENDIIGKEFPQNCGDSLIVLNKSNKTTNSGHTFLYKIKFLKYYHETFALKTEIILGRVNNPQIEQVEFIDKIWPQKCGDSLKIIEKSDKRGYWKCEFTKYPYKVEISKQNIIKGIVNNPQIEQVEFIDKIWPQNCGDSLKIIEKSKEKRLGGNEYLWKAKFIKYPCEILVEKNKVLKGQIFNKEIFYLDKYKLESFIKINFDTRVTLNNLLSKIIEKGFNLSISNLGQKINEFKLRKYIEYYPEGSNQEQELRKFCLSLNNSFLQESCWNELDGKEIDIYSPNLKLGFEFDGNLWHSNHEKFGVDNNYHQEKSLQAQEKGIQLIHIWEWEWSENKEKIQNFIKSKLGIFERKIFARKCKVKEIDNKTYQDFCNENHLQSSAGAKVKLGLFYEEELIQVMSFGIPRFTNDFEYEIIRECSKQDYIILGGKEKLWKYFIKNFQPKSVISYCDFSKFTGDSYLKLGFKKERLNKPGFVWWDKNLNVTYPRSPWKHNEMKEKGYLKIYDAGQLVFVWNK